MVLCLGKTGCCEQRCPVEEVIEVMGRLPLWAKIYGEIFVGIGYDQMLIISRCRIASLMFVTEGSVVLQAQYKDPAALKHKKCS